MYLFKVKLDFYKHKKKIKTRCSPLLTFFSLLFFLTVKAAAYRIFVKSSFAFTNKKKIENSNRHLIHTLKRQEEMELNCTITLYLTSKVSNIL